MANTDMELKQLLADVFGEDPQSITDESSIDTIDQWTSLRHLNLVVALEERFNIQLSEEETLEIISVALIKAVLADHGIVFGEALP
ncbi:MAG: acyl carrier protein [Cyanobacteriota bacterium]|nr:acyl carrier protein [Cyanobacteriota bacterium]